MTRDEIAPQTTDTCLSIH